MIVRDLLTDYYRYANQGDWDRWCGLFAPGAVVDEQLAGRIEGRDGLRALTADLGRAYTSFANVPRHVLVDGGQAAVVSRVTARGALGDLVEADVANYFRIEGGRIAYLANFHDTAPFRGDSRRR
ncbi:nuclear transport factor 2 family protein [Streptomyces luteireticuli]|uniref:nuclear transport factor 2 family protein n=1 Tax=Streptomyces luteireticuli TaxID=173858 RepID=UPI00355797EC